MVAVEARQEPGPVPDRRGAAVAAVVLCALLAVVILVTTPWHPLPGARATADPGLDFTPAQIARSGAFNDALDPPRTPGSR